MNAKLTWMGAIPINEPERFIPIPSLEPKELIKSLIMQDVLSFTENINNFKVVEHDGYLMIGVTNQFRRDKWGRHSPAPDRPLWKVETNNKLVFA